MSPRLDQIGRLSVWVYFADHRRPHIQVRGDGVRANVDILTGEVLAGALSVKDHRDVRRYVASHREALIEAFYAALRHEEASTIVARYQEVTDEL